MSHFNCYHSYTSDETIPCTGGGWGSPDSGMFRNDYFDLNKNHYHVGSRTEYHSVDTSYHGWGPEVNVGSFWNRPTRAGLFSPLLRNAALAHPEHSSPK